MRTLILFASLMVLAARGFAQGMVNFDNTTGSDPSPVATSKGLIWRQAPDGPAVLETGSSLYGTLRGGPSPASLAVLNSFDAGGPNSGRVLMDYNVVPGQYIDDLETIYFVPGVGATQFAYFQVQLWEGTAPNYAAAVAAGGYAGQSAVFSQEVGGPDLPPSLFGMPAIILTIPEPDMFSLAGLGTVVLLIFRRRKEE